MGAGAYVTHVQRAAGLCGGGLAPVQGPLRLHQDLRDRQGRSLQVQVIL